MANYDKEQGHPDGEGDALSTDLKPWIRREWGVDTFVAEFPYFQYAGRDFPPEDDDRCKSYLDKDWTADDPREWPDTVARTGPYRTDLVGVNVDRRALRTRIRRLGHAKSMNGSGQTKRRRRRTYLSFVADGPMRRSYWEGDHGGEGEVRTYGESSASRGFGWLKKRGFLISVGNLWDAVDIPLHIHGRTHAFELKLSPGEWNTALKQAARADCFADYRWVVYDRDTAPTKPGQLDAFRDAGIGLITVHPEDGVDIPVWARQCTPEVDRDLLDRYNVERWDLNERVMSQLNTAREYHHEYSEDKRERVARPGTPDILGDIGVLEIEQDPRPPTVHGGRAEPGPGAEDATPEDTDHRPLTAFAGDGDE